jgi:hypothetical protein
MYNTGKLTILIHILKEISNEEQTRELLTWSTGPVRDFGKFFLPYYVTSVRYALQRNYTENWREKNSRKETARPQSQFLQACT